MSLLTPREKSLAIRIAGGDSYLDIAVDRDVSEESIRYRVKNLELKIKRENKLVVQTAEYQSLVANLKASKKPLAEISIEGLFPTRLYNQLHWQGINTLGDIVEKGYQGVYRMKGIYEISIRNISEVLGYFGVEWPAS